jgi:hypothetical protein
MNMQAYKDSQTGEAVVRYLDHEFQVMKPGAYVMCAVTNKQIMLSDLTYWSVLRQEAYCDLAASVKQELEKSVNR